MAAPDVNETAEQGDHLYVASRCVDDTTPLENLFEFSSTDKHVPDAADAVTLAQKK